MNNLSQLEVVTKWYGGSVNEAVTRSIYQYKDVLLAWRLRESLSSFALMIPLRDDVENGTAAMMSYLLCAKCGV